MTAIAARVGRRRRSVPLRDPLHREHEALQAHRLEEVVDHANFIGVDRAVVVRGHHDHLDRPRNRTQYARKLKTIQPRHADVQQCDIGRIPASSEREIVAPSGCPCCGLMWTLDKSHHPSSEGIRALRPSLTRELYRWIQAKGFEVASSTSTSSPPPRLNGKVEQSHRIDAEEFYR